MKKIVCLILLLVVMVSIPSFSYAQTKNKDDIQSGTYIIGTYVFDKDSSNYNQNYNGTLTTPMIILASKSINSNNLNDMKIYYKNARGKWINAISGASETNVPNTFEITCVDLNCSHSFTPTADAYDTYTSSNVGSATYIIGRYLFDKNKNQNYNGTLTTPMIMLASKSINSNDLSDMKIYYKNARGKWINAINGSSETNVPTSFEITYVDLIKTATNTKQDDKITITEKTYTYDGNNKTATFTTTSGLTPTVTYYSNSTCTTAATPKNAGTYYATATTIGNDSYNAASLGCTKAVTINQRTVSITAPTVTSSTLTYNNQDQIISGAAGSCTTGGTMYYYTKNYTSSSAPTFNTTDWSTTYPTVKGKNAGTYYMWYYCSVSDTTNNKGTGINTAKSVTKSIAKAANPISVTANQSMSLNTSSSAQNKTFTAAANTEGTVTYSVKSQKKGSTNVSYFSIGTSSTNKLTVAANTPVGTYTVIITVTAAGNTNYKSGSKDITLTITINNVVPGKQNDTISITPKTYTYDGNNKTATFTTTSGLTPIVTYYSDNKCTIVATPKNAGTYYAIAETSGNNNYNPASLDCAMAVTINQANNPISVTSSQSWSPAYSTSAQNKTFTAATNAEGNVTYSIKSQKKGSTNVTNFSIGTNTTNKLTMAANTEVGTYTVVITATATGNTNYKSGSKDITMTVTVGKLADTINVTAKEYTYDGNNKTATFTTTSGLTPTVTYYSDSDCTTTATPKNAGTYYAKATTTGNDIYAASSLSCTKAVTINQANNPISVTSTQSWSPSYSTSAQNKTFTAATNAQGSVTYSIKSQKKGSTTVTNFSIGTNTTNKLIMSASTLPGTYTVVITATAAGNTNYKSGSKDITMTVTVGKLTDTINITAKEYTYNGSNKTATFTTTSGLTPTVTYYSNSSCTATATPKNAGTYYAKATTSGNDIYAEASLGCTKSVTINQRTVTVTAPTVSTAALIYNAQDQTISGNAGSCTTGGTMYYYKKNYSSTTAPAFNTTDWSTDNTATGRDVGTYYMWYYCYVPDTTNNTGTGINTAKSVTKKISKSNDTIAITAPEGVNYDGNAHEATVTKLSSDASVVTVNYYYDSKCKYPMSSAPVRAGMYYAKASTTGDNNYNPANLNTCSPAVKINLNKKITTFDMTYFHGLKFAEINQSNLNQLKQLGITTIPLTISTTDERAAFESTIEPLLRENNFKVIILDYNMAQAKTLSVAESNIHIFCQDTIDFYNRFDIVVGYYLGDEPELENTLLDPKDKSDVLRLGKVANEIKANDTYRYIYVNLYPTDPGNAPGNEHLSGFNVGSNYPVTYLKKYYDTVSSDIISVDQYGGFVVGTNTAVNRNQYYQNLIYIQQLHPTVPMNVTLITRQRESLHYVTSDEIAWQLSVQLASGMKRFSFFTYSYVAPSDDPSFDTANNGTGLVNSSLAPTEHFYNVEIINAWANNYGKELFNKSLTNIYTLNDDTIGTMPTYASKASNHLGTINSTKTGLISFFNDGSFMIVNTSLEGDSDITFANGSTSNLMYMQWFNPKTNKWEDITGTINMSVSKNDTLNNRNLSDVIGTIYPTSQMVRLKPGHSILMRKKTYTDYAITASNTNATNTEIGNVKGSTGTNVTLRYFDNKMLQLINKSTTSDSTLTFTNGSVLNVGNLEYFDPNTATWKTATTTNITSGTTVLATINVGSNSVTVVKGKNVFLRKKS